MLFEPSIDKVAQEAGNVYAATILIGARAKELVVKTNMVSSSEAIYIAAKEVANGEIKGEKQGDK